MSSMRWLAEYVEADGVVFRIGRDEDRVVAEWIGLATLSARRDGTGVRFDPVTGADPHTVEKVRRGSAALLLRQLEGKLALHGAAVDVDGRALVLLGRSGEGKSTLAAALCACADARLLSDDAVAVEEGPSSGEDAAAYVVAPLEENHWLDEPSREALSNLTRATPVSPWSGGKAPVRAPRVGEQSVPLLAVIELAFDSSAPAPRLRERSGLDAVAALVPQCVRFVLDEPAVHRRELERLADVVARVPVMRLDRPRRLDALASTVDLLVSYARGIRT